MPLDMAWVPPSLVAWVLDPVDDPCLGDKIVRDLSQYAQVLSVDL